jgi:hypothetical protein
MKLQVRLLLKRVVFHVHTSKHTVQARCETDGHNPNIIKITDRFSIQCTNVILIRGQLHICQSRAGSAARSAQNQQSAAA